MRYVSERHFYEGVWASTGPLRLRRYTCVVCGTRLPTQEEFRAHRRACAEQAEAGAPPASGCAPPVAA